MTSLRPLGILTYLSCVRVGAVKMHRKIPVLMVDVLLGVCGSYCQSTPGEGWADVDAGG